MPTYVKGNMWDQWGKTDLFCITTNSVIKKNGELIMGKGIAGEAAQRFQGLALEAGKITYLHHLLTYGLRVLEVDGYLMGLFQTKKEWWLPSSLSVIRYSVDKLLYFMDDELYYNSDARVDLAFPGINNGQLTKEQIKPLLLPLPNNVYIWSLE